MLVTSILPKKQFCSTTEIILTEVPLYLSECTNQFPIHDAPKDNKTIIPEILYKMLQSNEINSRAFSICCIYLRFANSEGCCGLSIHDMCKYCGMSKASITKHRNLLTNPFKSLNGQSLITILPRTSNEIITVKLNKKLDISWRV